MYVQEFFILMCSLCVFLVSGDGISHPPLPAVPTLVKVFVAMRHGSRAPSYGTYQNDTYKKDDKRFWPAGPGELTKKGKQEVFELGQMVRARYNGFLGNYYTSKDFRAFSTLKERTIMSAQLLLAAIFPPENYQLWSSDLKWQPVPVYPDYIINRTDDLNCPWFLLSSKEEMQKTPASEFGFNEEDITLLEGHIGPYDKDPFTFMSKLWDVWSTLYFQEKEGLELPNWTKTVHSKMSTAILKYLKFYLSGTPTRKAILRTPYGLALSKYFNESNRKMEIHSWHDMNMMALIATLGVEIEEYFETPSCLAIELHNKNGEHYLEVYYYRNSKLYQPRLLKMPCGTSCPSNDLIKTFQSYSEKNFDDLCFSKESVDAFNNFFNPST